MVHAWKSGKFASPVHAVELGFAQTRAHGQRFDSCEKACAMSTDDDKRIHVSMTGENWEVESSTRTLAQAETKEEAIEEATAIAKEQPAEAVTIHTSDGMVEKEIRISKPAESPVNPET